MDSNMDVDPVEPGTPQRIQGLVSTATAPFTPPYGTDGTPEGQSSDRDMRAAAAAAAAAQRGQRASDSAAPESPSESSRRHVFVQPDSKDTDENGYDNMQEPDYLSHELRGMPVDESETIIHRDFADSFGNDWTDLS